MLIAIVTFGWFLGLLLTAWAFLRFVNRRQVQRRLFDSAYEQGVRSVDLPSRTGFLTGWLSLAGYRGVGAEAGFVAASLAALAAGATLAYLIWVSGLLAEADHWISLVPGGLSNMMRPMLIGVPWMLLAIVASLPVLTVRRARRRRVAQIERDLPITLELLATLAEAGLGFDAALDRILTSQPANRALADELRTFQAELLGGRPRVECLRRVARRLDVTAITVFISSLVQAEQIGSGMAEVLRSQSDDLRQRRRERAIEFSMALPVKLLFPLVICFLPGILVFTIGPAFYDFFRLADSYARSHSF